MQKAIDAFWRAAAYCLHPRVIGLSLLPLLVAVLLAVGLGYFYWEAATEAVSAWLERWSLSQYVFQWLDSVGLSAFRAAISPFLVVVLAVPVVAIVSLLLVALMMMPALVRLVVSRRFAQLESRHRASWLVSLGLSLGVTAVALFLTVLSLPLWLIPPFALVVPPLIWGWMTYRVMSFDALAGHATAEERQTLLRQHRQPLLVMGIVCGYLGAAPAALWALSVFTVFLAPVLVVVSIWIYTLVFAFSSLWFCHFLLAALHELRARGPTDVLDPLARGPGAGSSDVDTIPYVEVVRKS